MNARPSEARRSRQGITPGSRRNLLNVEGRAYSRPCCNSSAAPLHSEGRSVVPRELRNFAIVSGFLMGPIAHATHERQKTLSIRLFLKSHTQYENKSLCTVPVSSALQCYEPVRYPENASGCAPLGGQSRGHLKRCARTAREHCYNSWRLRRLFWGRRALPQEKMR